MSLELKNAPIEKAFEQIKKQTGYSFVYTREQIKNTIPLTLKVNNVSLRSALEQCLVGQPLTYIIDEKQIILQNKKVQRKESPVKVVDVSQTLSGRILDERSEPLSGAFVKIKETTLATISDARGNFKLPDIPENAVLQVSFVGYFTQEIVIGNARYLEIHLVQNIGSLDETVVVAYGTTTKRYNTGSISKVSSDQIATQPVSNPLAALQGRVSGLNIVQNTGLPGSTFSVLIRGRNSIQNGTSPLFIIDGVPFLSDAERLTQVSQINANHPFNTLNPSDIESVSILKDADATSIYGSRGANGVILITTKKGASNRTKLDISLYKGWGKANYRSDFLNTKEYIQLRRDAFTNDKMPPTTANAPDLLLWDTTRYTDWKRKLIGNTARILNAQVRFSGGSKSTHFSVSANHYGETTVFPGDAGLKRNTVAFMLNHRSDDNRLNTTFNVNYGSNNSKLYQQDLTQFVTSIPNLPNLYDSSGVLNWIQNGASFDNPMANIFRTYNVLTDRITGNATISYTLGKVELKSDFGYNHVHVDENSRYPISSQNPAFHPFGVSIFGNSSTKSWIVEPQIHYKTKFLNNSYFQFLAGTTFQGNINDYQVIKGSGYANDNLLNSTTGATELISTVYKDLLYRYQAMYARANTNLFKKYILNLTYRRDGSSRFGPGKQFANFGSVGGAWIFSEEHAIKNNLQFLSFGKLRGSYGISGNDQIGDYQYMDTWTNTNYPYGTIPGLYPSRITNPYYSWENKKNLEAGVDLGLFSDKVLINLNWFRSRSDNQIIQYTLPDQTGSNNILRNFPGVVQNTGWELETSIKMKESHDFSWLISMNLTLPKNKLISFPGLANSSYANSYVIGAPLSVIKGYEFLGVNTKTGLYEFKDINNDNLLNSEDYVKIGHTDPRYYGGFQNTINWGNIEFQFFIQFVKQNGRHIIYSNPQLYGIQNNQTKLILDRWKEPGDEAPYQQSSQTFFNPAFGTSFLVFNSSAILTDASYARLKNISLSYKLPNFILQRLKTDKIRLFFEGQNLVTLTKFKGPDPESQRLTVLPPLRILTVGAEISF